MEFWENLTKAALLGTQKHSLDTEQLPDAIQEVLSKVELSDKEDAFLKTVALAMNYANAGSSFSLLQTPVLPPSEPEVLTLCSREVIEVLRRILYEKQDELLQTFLQQLAEQNLRITEELIPDILDKGKDLKELRTLISKVTGKRGEWLTKLNPEWQYISQVSVEETWQTGKPEERKEALATIRREDPAKAREWLLEVWKSEKSANKTAFLSLFSTNLSMADEPMLEEMLVEKARTVKDVVDNLLFQLSASRLIARVWSEVHTWIKLPKKASLPAFKKIKLKFEIPATLSKDLEYNGIVPEKDKFLTQSQHKFSRSSFQHNFHHLIVKGLTQSEAWLYQAFLIIPPHQWHEASGFKREEFINLLLNDDLSYLVPALANAACLHQDMDYIRALLPLYLDKNKFLALNKDKSGFYIKFNLIDGLPLVERKAYEQELIGLLEEDNYQFYNYIEIYSYEWPVTLAIPILQKIAEKCSSSKYYYHYYDSKQVQKLNPYLPVSILHEWERLQPKDEMGKTRWQQATALLLNSLELKKRLKEVFEQ